jgi:hypothetical protein
MLASSTHLPEGQSNKRTNLFLIDGPWQALRVAETHASEDGNGNAKTALAEATVFDFGVLDGLEEAGRGLWSGHFCSLFLKEKKKCKLGVPCLFAQKM